MEMGFLFVTLIAISIIALTNHYDKYLIKKYSRNYSIGVLLIFSSFIGIPAALLILMFNPGVLDVSDSSKILLILSGFLYIISLIPYMYALKSDEVSNVMPYYLIAPIITYLLSFIFLKEILNISQIIGSILIIAGLIILSAETDRKNKRREHTNYFMLSMVLLSSFLLSAITILFKYAAIEDGYVISVFWNQLGYIIAGITLFLVPRYRKGFLKLLRGVDGKLALANNTFGEIINLSGDLVYRYAILLGPVALVQTIALGLQPILVFIWGIVFTLFIPSFSKENINKELIFKRLTLLCIMCVAVFIMQS